MTVTIALAPTTSTAPGHLRPLNVLRDLPAVADLIELCFAATLDPEGRNYIDQMRRNGRDYGFLNWAPRAIDTVSLPLSGFVWEYNGRIVGNVSLIPFFKNGQRVFLIANVATHPDFRRQGIARMLTSAALRRAGEKYASAVWLHVRQDNSGAISLYRQLGFVERARRTIWYASSSNPQSGNSRNQAVNIQIRPAGDWPIQSAWLENHYPANLDWYFPRKWNVLNPSLLSGIYRFFAEIDIQQWSAYREGTLQAVVACEHSHGRSDYLWLAVPEQPDPAMVTMLLFHSRRMLSQRYSLALEFPANIIDDAISRAGFLPQRTLVWMEASDLQPAR